MPPGLYKIVTSSAAQNFCISNNQIWNLYFFSTKYIKISKGGLGQEMSSTSMGSIHILHNHFQTIKFDQIWNLCFFSMKYITISKGRLGREMPLGII